MRVFFRELYSLPVEIINSDSGEDKKVGKESDMANGLTRNGKYHANIPLSLPNENGKISAKKIKKE